MAVGPGSAAMDLSTTLSSAYRYNQNMMEYYTCKIQFFYRLFLVNFKRKTFCHVSLLL